MWDYIVLGQVPGTSVQVSFENWLVGIAGLVGIGLLYKLIRVLSRSRPVAMLHISLIMQSTGYSRLLATRPRIGA